MLYYAVAFYKSLTR